jgi:peroxiredoxin
MKRVFVGATLAALTVAVMPAFAALAVGVTAPAINGNVYVAGKGATFKLQDALRKGPVVLFFFPGAYTAGCNVEAKAFADNIDKFTAAGATVVGVTAGHGNSDRADGKAAASLDEAVKDFSATHCSGKFPVMAVTPDTVKAYDASLAQRPDWSGRISYVVAKDGKISFVHNAMNPAEHVTKTLEAVTALKTAGR